jgi:hypothetical protein
MGKFRSEFSPLGSASAHLALARTEAGIFRLFFAENPAFLVPNYGSHSAGRCARRGRAEAALRDDKLRIVEETQVPGAKVTEVARRNGVAASVVFI